MQMSDLQLRQPLAGTFTQDYEAQVKFDCNYSDEDLRRLTAEKGEEWLAGIYQKGDIVTIRPKALVYLPHDKGGRPWGKRDVVDFVIVTFKNLTQEEANSLVESVVLATEAEIEEGEIGRHDTMVAQRRHMIDIDEALQAKAPITLMDPQKKAKFYAKATYDDVEQPLQNADCCLKHVSDISKTPKIQDRAKKIKEKMSRENPTQKIVNGRKRTLVKGIKNA